MPKIEAASKFNPGVECLAAALVDLKLHLAATPDRDVDPDAYEKTTLAALGMPKEIVMRHRTPPFSCAFSQWRVRAGASLCNS